MPTHNRFVPAYRGRLHSGRYASKQQELRQSTSLRNPRIYEVPPKRQLGKIDQEEEGVTRHGRTATRGAE